jgi:hypothetical protein
MYDFKEKYHKYKQKYLILKGGKNKYKVGDVVEIIGSNSRAKITEVLEEGLSYNLKEIIPPYTIIRSIAEQEIKDFRIENPANKVIKGPKNSNIQQTNYPDLDLTDWNFITVCGDFKTVSTEFTIYEHKFNNDK